MTSSTSTSKTKTDALDLTKQFPRSPNTLLGDYVILARTIDKCRAEVAGTAGEYHWNCPLAKIFFDFKEIKPEDFEVQIKAGKSDEEILAWVEANGKKRQPEEVLAWGYDSKQWQPTDTAKKAYVEGILRNVAPHTPYLTSFFQMLDAEEGRL